MKIRSVLLASAMSIAAIGQASAQEAVTFGTNWLAQPEHGGYYQAVADGTYAACGLNVTIAQGGPQVNNRALLLAGKIQFHMGGNLLQAFSAVEQEIPLRVVAAHMQKEPQVIMTHPGQGLDTWEDLLKADQYIIGNGGFNSYFKWMIGEFGFDTTKRVPYTFNPAPFVANKRSAQQGYATSEPFAIKREGGFEPNVFLIADYGFNTYATTVEVMQDTIDNKADQVKCFVDGSAKGWYNYLYGDNAAANKLIQKDNPDMSDEQIAFSIAALKKHGIVDSGESLKNGIGAMSAERIEDFYNKMVKAKVVAAGLDLSKVYTLDFINKGVGMDLKK